MSGGFGREKGMEGGWGDGGFSPRTTVEDIQRRLLRPSSLHSPSLTPSISSLSSLGKDARGRNSLQPEANYSGLYRKRDAEEGQIVKKKKKLEDYLDPVLLSAISSKINRTEKDTKMILKREVKHFEWPVDELRMLREDSVVGKEKNDSVNLSNDSDRLTGNGVDGDDKFCTPFTKFEQTGLRLFKL